MPKMMIVLYVLYVLCGVMGALWLRKQGPRWLMFWSVVFIVYSSLPAIALIIDSRSLNNSSFELVGQSLLVFFSVVGGALFSSAWNELRAETRARQIHGG